MTKAASKRRRAIVEFPAEIQQMIEEATLLRGEEQRLLDESQRVGREAVLRAFSVGRMIHETPRQYSEGVVKALAKRWGCTAQTVYNYDHLFCGAVYESNILNHPEITRDYFQALGSSIRWCDDFLGYAVHLQLLLTPAYRTRKSGERQVDDDKVMDIGKLVKHARMIATDDLGAGHLLNSWCREPVGKDGVRFTFPAQETDSEKGVELRKLCGLLLHEVCLLLGQGFGAVRLKEFGDIKDELYGSATPDDDFRSLTAKMLLIRRERLRRQKRAYGGTTPSLDKSVDARLHRGRCEAVICDRQAFPERSVDVVLTDPPYSDEYYESWKRWTRVEHDAEKDVKKQAALLGTIARLLVQRRIIREQFFWFSFCPLDVVHEFLPPLLRAFEGEDFVHQVLAWDKGGSTKVEATRTFARQVEAVMYINVGTRPLAMLKREGAEPRLMHSSLLRFPAGHKDENNVFWKPVPLLKHLIALATGESQASEARRQVVLDPFAGSGSTGVAAIECGRDFRLIESHPKQYDDCRASVLLALKEARRGEE